MNADKYYLKHHIIFLIFIGINQALSFWVHLLIYATGIKFVPFLYDYRVLFGYLMAVLSVSFVIGNIFLHVGHNKFLGNIYHLAAVWMGTVFWLFIGAVLLNIINLFFGSTLPPEFFTDFAGVVYLLACSISIYGLYHQKDVRIKNIDVQIKDLPQSWEGRKAVLFTDSHYGPVHTLDDAQKLSKMIQEQNPDIVFMGGDFYDGPPTNFVELGEAFKDLKPKLGKYFVTGNHEEYAGKARAIGGVEAGGFIITDGNLNIVEGVQILGVPYERHETKASIDEMLDNIGYKNNIPSIVLKHVPDDLFVLSKRSADLVLCGHTHKGQIWPFSLLTKWVYKGYDYGLKYLNNTQVYTSSGVGTWGPPQRIGTHSELVIFNFKNKNQ